MRPTKNRGRPSVAAEYRFRRGINFIGLSLASKVPIPTQFPWICLPHVARSERDGGREGWRAQRAILPEFKKAVLPELVWPSTSHTSVRAGPRHITIILSIIYLLIIVPSQTMAAAAALFMSH